jgi:hypothetical protein
MLGHLGMNPDQHVLITTTSRTYQLAAEPAKSILLETTDERKLTINLQRIR